MIDVTPQHNEGGVPLFGRDDFSRIVAIERAGDASVRLFRRKENSVQSSQETHYPWLVTSDERAPVVTRLAIDHERLEGDSTLSALLRFRTWSAWSEAARILRESESPLMSFGSPIEQYLIESGRGLFRSMEFDELLRAQIDIETLTLDPRAADAAIMLIVASVNGREPVVFRRDELSEREMIDALGDWIRSRDPDVIEGHNIFNFDVPYLAERAQAVGTSLNWGRNGAPLRLGSEQRVKVGPRSVPFQSAWVFGRHIVDTYQQIQRYDTGGQFESYALKPVIEQLGMRRDQRTLVAGAEVASAWNTRRDELVRYAVDDALDVNVLSELVLPTEFYQAQILPRSLQSAAIGGPGEKVNDLLARAYLAARHSIPLPGPSRGYPGGLLELREVGRFAPVVKCDVESLYPSIMLHDRIAPASDTLGIFLPMLRVLTERRIAAKRMEATTAGLERARWRGLQTSFKVLINSFYGYLGYGRAHFNDFDAAKRVTLRGQEIIVQVVEQLEARGGRPIEVDTDGVLFQPPSDVIDEQREVELIESISSTLPSGIRLTHDGRYRGMLSLRLKNYALLSYDGRIALRGSGLRSRREERYLRAFIHDAVARLLEPDEFGSVRRLYLDVAARIASGAFPIDEISRWESVTDQTFHSDANRRLADAIGDERVGERVNIYQRADGSLARVGEYDHDEDRVYLLRRLRDAAERFRPLYACDAAFEYDFPAVSTRTDIAALRATPPTTQLSLFRETS